LNADTDLQQADMYNSLFDLNTTSLCSIKGEL